MASNFNDTLPAPPAGYTNVQWQTDGGGNDSAYVPTAILTEQNSFLYALTAGDVMVWNGSEWINALPPGGSSSIDVDGTPVANPNLVDSATVAFTVVGSNITATATGGSYNGPTTQTAYTSPTRQPSVIYQNTGSTPRYISACGNANSVGSGNTGITLMTDSSPTPSTIVSSSQGGLNVSQFQQLSIFGIVLPGNYYEITLIGGGTETIDVWVEWQ